MNSFPKNQEGFRSNHYIWNLLWATLTIIGAASLKFSLVFNLPKATMLIMMLLMSDASNYNQMDILPKYFTWPACAIARATDTKLKMKRAVGHNLAYIVITNNIVEMVFTKAAQAFGNLLMGCILNINTVLTTVEK